MLRSISLFAFAMLSTASIVLAGELEKRDIEKQFPAPLVVGEKEPTLALWPIFKPAVTAESVRPSLDLQGRTVWPSANSPGRATGPTLELLGYAFEAVDVSPTPGYSGKLINLLIALDAKGKFIDVRLLSHHEPLFLGGLGDQLMASFAKQYNGLSVKQTIRILNDSQAGSAAAQKAPPGVASLKGISRGTVTVELMDKTIMTSAIKIARMKLGIVGTMDPDKMAKLRADLFGPADWIKLEQEGLIQSLLLKGQEIEKPFLGTAAVNQDPQGTVQGDNTAIEFRVALLSLPQIGRNLLDEAGYQKVEQNLKKGFQSLLIVSRGRYSFIGDDYLPAGGLNRMVLKQGDTEIELKDFVFDHPIKLPPEWERKNAKVVTISGYAGLDPGRSLEISYRLKRIVGVFNKQTFEGLYPLNYVIPAKYLIVPPAPEPAWKNAWRNQAVNLVILVLGLLVLSAALLKQRWLVGTPKRLKWFRNAFLVFTLCFIGWYGQGQLSIVNITATIEALRLGNALDFLLFDPMSATLWVFVLISLFIWGRGTFCGWLCPFGALQELISKLLGLAGFKGWRLHTKTDARLKWLKYFVLGFILVAALFSAQWTQTSVEVEPFKTSISLYFVRGWPYVLWAVLCLALSVGVYRGYCRYICPLGAALAVFGKLRLFAWIPRRAECGTPCQTCRHRCEYQAIESSGKVAYQECFQCLDCVEIHDSDEKCAPLIIAKRKHRLIPISLATGGIEPSAALRIMEVRRT